MKTGKTLIDLVRTRLGGSAAKKTNLERKRTKRTTIAQTREHSSV
jgi:hypothetical protein